MSEEQFKILIVDDERANLAVLSHILKPGCPELQPFRHSLSIAKSGRAALDISAAAKPDLILMDIIMPGLSGFEVLSRLKASGETRGIPVIIITGLSSVEEEEKGFAMGAVDYITKPFHSSIVCARVKTQLRIAHQIRTIEQLGCIDVLTNLTNRRGFDMAVGREWRRAAREKSVLSLLMIDIDRFKGFNDTYGHQQGDDILKAVAEAAAGALRRPADIAARWGGEEFAVLLPATDKAGAQEVAEGIRRAVEAIACPEEGASPGMGVTVSIGAASLYPGGDSPVSELIRRADKALYTAKETGRNRVCFDNDNTPPEAGGGL